MQFVPSLAPSKSEENSVAEVRPRGEYIVIVDASDSPTQRAVHMCIMPTSGGKFSPYARSLPGPVHADASFAHYVVDTIWGHDPARS